MTVKFTSQILYFPQMMSSRTLISQKRNDKALEIFKLNQQKNGDVYFVNFGLMFGYSAKGDYANALVHAQKAMAQASNEGAKKQLEADIAKLKEGGP